MNSDKSWYFYNTAVKNAGKTEFQKRWGSRKLEDDRRRRNKSSFAFSDFDESSEEPDDTGSDALPDGTADAADADVTPDSSDPHSVEYYLRQIPSTDAERATAHAGDPGRTLQHGSDTQR